MLKQFEKELSAYRKNNTLPQGDVKNALADIYEELWPQNKNWGASKVNRTCPSCVSDMMKSLCAHWESMQVKYEFDKPAVTYIVEGEVAEELTVTKGDVVKDMKWPQFKTYCKEQGLSVKGKTKKQLLKELGL